MLLAATKSEVNLMCLGCSVFQGEAEDRSQEKSVDTKRAMVFHDPRLIIEQYPSQAAFNSHNQSTWNNGFGGDSVELGDLLMGQKKASLACPRVTSRQQAVRCSCGSPNTTRGYHAHIASCQQRNLHNDMALTPTHSTDSNDIIAIDSSLDFPSILHSHNVMPETGISKDFGKTFAQVVQENFGHDAETPDDCAEEEETERISEDAALERMEGSVKSSSDEDSDSGVDLLDKFEGLDTYENHLQFAIKRGYAKSDLDRVIGECGLECDDNQLLQKLISTAVCHQCENDTDNDKAEDTKVSSVESLADTMQSDVFVVGVTKKHSNAEHNGNGAGLRHVIIDGSNVAMSQGNNVFSCRRIQIAVDWFRQRGHEEVTVFVPQWRKETSRPAAPITEQAILFELEKEGVVVFTPSRRIRGRRMVCYDDRFVLSLAAQTQGVVVSNDTYRDLLKENDQYRAVVDDRLLMYTFVADRFMPPEDPLGRHGPTLDQFLRKNTGHSRLLTTECPYGRKCTYGNKCKYDHPERGCQPHRTVSEVLKEQAAVKMQERATRLKGSPDGSHGSKTKLMRTHSLAPVEHSSEQTMSLSPNNLREDGTKTSTSVNSPGRKAGKTADYLREHRKKLEVALAIAAVADNVSATNGLDVMLQASEKAVFNQPHDGFNTIAASNPRVSSASRVNVSAPSTTEPQLVSGHLLVAQKLSDDISKSDFFTPKNSAGKANPLTNHPTHDDEIRAFSRPGFEYGCQPSLENCQQQYQPFFPYHATHRNMPGAEERCVSYPAHFSASMPPGLHYDYESVPEFGGRCQSYPTTEKERDCYVMNRIVGQNDQFFVTDIHSNTPKDLKHCIEQGVSQYMNAIPRPFHSQHLQAAPDSQSRSVSGPVFESRGPGLLNSAPRMPQHALTNNFPHHHTNHHYRPPPVLSPPPTMREVSHSGASVWEHGLHHMAPSSPVQGIQTSQHPHGHAMQHHQQRPIAVSDSRYPLYYHMCGIFAEHRVRAVMNRYPDLTDPSQLSACIVEELRRTGV